MSPDKARAILAKRKMQSIDPERIFDRNFPQQIAFIKDPAKLKCLFCTRRAAKSYTAGLYLVFEALTNPGVNCLFLGLTRASSKGIIWKDILKILNKQFDLKATFNSTELTMTFPNGSVIFVTGADADEDEMNKLLGRKYRLVCIDEASMYSINMHQMVYGVLKPAMSDNRGTICLMGTASNFARGLFYDITNGKEAGWSLHTWSAHDNPHVAVQWQEELDQIDNLRPLFKETPLFKQWYLNHWTVDTDKLVYKFNADRNLFDKQPQLFPEDDWIYVLGVDTGWEDDNAFVLTGYHSKDKHLHVVKTFNKSHMTFDQVMMKVQEFINDKRYPIAKVIIDGANKQGVESMRTRSLIPFEYAEKQDKVTFIEIMNGDLIQGKIKIQKDLTVLINELQSLVWQTDGDKIRLPKKEHPSLPNHLCDAFLYAWRCGFHYAYQQPTQEIVPYSDAWYKQQEQIMAEKAYDQAMEEHSRLQNDPFQVQDTMANLDKWRRG